MCMNRNESNSHRVSHADIFSTFMDSRIFLSRYTFNTLHTLIQLRGPVHLMEDSISSCPEIYFFFLNYLFFRDMLHPRCIVSYDFGAGQWGLKKSNVFGAM